MTSQSRARSWGDTRVNVSMTSAGAQASPLDLLSELVSSDRITVVRLVGHLYLVPVSLTATNAGIIQTDLGIGVASIEAFNVAGGIPDADDPTDVPIRNWLWADTLVMYHENAGGTEVVAPTFGEVRFDLRAMRKVDRGRLYLTMVSSSLAGTMFSVRVFGRVRALCLT